MAGVVRQPVGLEKACIVVVFFMLKGEQKRNRGCPCIIVGKEGFVSSNVVRTCAFRLAAAVCGCRAAACGVRART